MAVRGDRLFVLRIASGGQLPEVRIDSYSLAPDQVSISVTDNPEALAGAEQPGHFRRWQFRWSSEHVITVVGELWHRHRDWGTPGPTTTELFARRLARHLGWAIPEKT
jgi:hypothetical protein